MSQPEAESTQPIKQVEVTRPSIGVYRTWQSPVLYHAFAVDTVTVAS
jgi:hypothetical protein